VLEHDQPPKHNRPNRGQFCLTGVYQKAHDWFSNGLHSQITRFAMIPLPGRAW